ncbi:protein SPEAR1 [Brachypodium distachyon]|nr:protein SPEAR1 [Brachypodium distachyon]|eukprot:XP_014754375.1 protein SPEAR1 [Brachypodium distachyon]
MGSSIHHGAGEMCLEAAAAGGRSRRGGKKQAASAAAAAEQQKVPKQPQRGLGVAQLEKIRMQNQMIAAYRSGGLNPPPPSQHQQQQVHFAAAAAAGPPPPAAASPFQPSSYLTGCFETMDHRRIAADVQYGQYYAENLLPYGSSRPPATSPLYVVVHDAKDSSPPSGYMQHTPQYDYWAARSSGGHELSGGAGSTEELDLELRL